MKKKKIILIILGLCTLVGTYTAYDKWHYNRANAFYISRQRNEPLYDQQKAFVKNVNPKVMEKLEIEVSYKERSSELYGMTKVDKGVSYTFFPHAEDGSTSVALSRINNKERLCSFWFEKNLEKVDVIFSEVNEAQTVAYEKKAVRIYKQIFNDVYENWEIQ